MVVPQGCKYFSQTEIRVKKKPKNNEQKMFQEHLSLGLKIC